MGQVQPLTRASPDGEAAPIPAVRGGATESPGSTQKAVTLIGA